MKQSNRVTSYLYIGSQLSSKNEIKQNFDTYKRMQDTGYWYLDGYLIPTRGYLYLGYLQVGQPIKGMSSRWIALLWVTDKQPIERPWKLEKGSRLAGQTKYSLSKIGSAGKVRHHDRS